jgi:hypothetical protein
LWVQAKGHNQFQSVLSVHLKTGKEYQSLEKPTMIPNSDSLWILSELESRSREYANWGTDESSRCYLRWTMRVLQECIVMGRKESCS